MYGFLCLFLLITQVDAQERLAGDINGDGKVDFADFLLLSQNFGRTDGTPYDPNAAPDTVMVVVRDTLLVSDTEIVEVPRNKFLSKITVESGEWGTDMVIIQELCDAVRHILSSKFEFPLDSDIIVRANQLRSAPHIFLDRPTSGEHIIELSTAHEFLPDYIRQFAHEYGHVLSNYYTNRSGANKWFEEVISEMAALTVLLEFQRAAQWRVMDTYIPSVNTYEVGYLFSEGTLSTLIRNTFDDQKMESGFGTWLQSRLSSLRSDHNNRTDHGQIIMNLIDIFEDEPEAWNTIRYLTPYGPVSWDLDQGFGTYLTGWHKRTPARWQPHVVKVANSLGYQKRETVETGLGFVENFAE